jgi:uncharacterized membrane protein YgdD (TMEM256/DUF423 family)
MGLAASLVLIAAGAILRWAVSASTSGIDLRSVGLILLIVGIVGFVVSLMWMTFLADRWSRGTGPGRDPGYPQPRV